MSTPSQAHRPDAALWDLDGTLLDTEPLWKRAEHALVAEHGGVWTDEDALAIVGSDLIEAAEYIRRRAGIAVPAADIVERLVDDVIAGIGDTPAWRPGARELLAELGEAGIPCALVTMSWRRIVDHVDALVAGAPFAALVAGDEVANGKPHPEPYATAAARLGVDPADCIAIEDSPTGVASAEAAGCTVVAVPNMVPIAPSPGRTIVATLEAVDLATLRGLLARREVAARG